MLAYIWLNPTSPFNEYDSKVLDYIFRFTVRQDKGPKSSFAPGVVYLTITDRYYQNSPGSILNRSDLAALNNELAGLAPEAVAYDLIFAQPYAPDSDAAFEASLKNLGCVYLPVGSSVEASDSDLEPIALGKSSAFKPFIPENSIGTPHQEGSGRPFHAVKTVFQYPPFAKAAHGSGDISAPADPDAIHRHLFMVIKHGTRFQPSLSLSVFLGWAGIDFDDITIHWGRHIHIPSDKSSRLSHDVNIPIDNSGRTFIPFVGAMGEDFSQISLTDFFTYIKDPAMRGNFLELFEGNFIFVAETAVGISDLGTTPLQKEVPLVIIHASMLNALLSNTFYTKWLPRDAAAAILGFALIMAAGACFYSLAGLFGSTLVCFLSIPAVTLFQFNQFCLVPVATLSGSCLTIFLVLVITIEVITSRERAFIQSAFVKYVPEKVVKQILADPMSVRLGGHEMDLSVMFTDIENFTNISEESPPADLVTQINEYFTEMTKIIHDHGGIIDKYQGDAIMAEFGIPFPSGNHADQAVSTALDMQERLKELRQTWVDRNRPPFTCRIGINSGKMVVGNMGSDKVFDYTVMGDGVNLSSRLEGVNKKYGTRLLISQATYDLLSKQVFKTRIVDVIKVKGKNQAVRVYEVYGYSKQGEDTPKDRYARIYENAFLHYLDKDFLTAAEGFKQALAIFPEDPAACQLLERIEKINYNALDKNWDGSVTLKEK
ncbi:adenylate/guanylate cyclase domain-containing protein [uncultured Desulfobacter sp.]|uniref:adenylate/guanylate cyclase domain-containing protein n=1 Tax=uncultured Desulfobacter sp. TaxID=240139 RepID=UPI002AAAC0FE|nr:adenylate/guanylate cyclase domain-containing protein [uncultured Desulfobacter sp.]